METFCVFRSVCFAYAILFVSVLAALLSYCFFVTNPLLSMAACGEMDRI